MKKILASLLCAACLAFAGSASAAVQEFGPDFAKFTIDVKDGWTATAIDNGVQVVKADKSCALTIVAIKTEGAKADAIGKAVAEQAGMKDAKVVTNEPGNYVCAGTINGANTVIVTLVDGDKGVVSSVSGTNLDASSEILDTLKDK